MVLSAAPADDILLLLEEEHDLYRELLAVAQRQARLIACPPSAEALQQLVALREDLYVRIEAAELARDSLVEELMGVTDAIRAKALAIETTLRAILEQDRQNEQRLRTSWPRVSIQLSARG